MNPLKNHINGYEVEGAWSEGGMSTLYLAQNPITHEHLLVKTISPLHKQNRLAQERLEREASILKICNHKNIIKLLNHGTYKNEPFLALEFLRGASLRKILEQHPVPLTTALRLLGELCSAISYLHSLGFAHRDIKPENIFITDQGHAILIDFGLTAPLSKIGQLDYFEGTPFYMSPEVIQESSIATKERDIYALGMVAYEMILGRITHGKVLLAFLPKGLQSIIAKALLPDPQERYHSIEEFSSALSSYLESNAHETEHHGSDYFFELFEQATSLEKKVLTLAPREIIECSIASRCTINRYGMYVATFKRKNEIGFITIECLQKGLEGLVSSYICHYLINAAEKESLSEQLSTSHERLQKEFPLRCTYGVLNTQTLTLEYHTEYEGILLQSRGGMPYLPLSETKTQLQEEDRIVFVGFGSNLEPHILQQALDETSQTPIEQQAELLVQKLQIKSTWLEAEHPVCLLVLITKKQYN